MVGYRYIFHGKASHAAAAPEAGINALNAVIHLFTGIDAMRQHLREDVRIHGIITDGGKAPNVVPEYAAANFMLRCRDRNYLNEVVVGRVLQAAEGAASMTGARLEVQEFYPFYDNVRPNAAVAKALRANAERAGINLDQPLPGAKAAPLPPILATSAKQFRLSNSGTPSAKRRVPAHTREMTETATTEFACSNALAVAQALSLTARDLLEDPALLAAARKEFAARSGT